MKAVSKILAGGVAMAALASAAPAAAQYYPGYGQPNVIGQVLNQVLGGGYGVNSQAAVQRCAAAVEKRINYQYKRGYAGQGGYSGYGGYNPGYNQGYAYNQSTARVLGVTSVERRSGNGLRVRGVATARARAVGYGGYGQGGYGGYGQGGYSPYGGYAQPQQTGELTFRCNVDYRGYVTNVDIDRNRYAYGGYRNY